MKKIFLILLLFLLLFLVACQSSISQDLEGVLLKHSWEKSGDSFCAGGSDYLTLETSDESYVISYKYSLEEYVDKNVIVKGRLKSFETKCGNTNMQCTETYCEVLEIISIQER